MTQPSSMLAAQVPATTPAVQASVDRLWLRYEPVVTTSLLAAYRNEIKGISAPDKSPILAAARRELQVALRALLDQDIPLFESVDRASVVLAGTPATAAGILEVV